MKINLAEFFFDSEDFYDDAFIVKKVEELQETDLYN